MVATDTYYEMPELEETEFALAISPCPRIGDANDDPEKTHAVNADAHLSTKTQ